MSRKNTTEGSGLDIAGLLALKAFEHPNEKQFEKNIQNTMQAVRAAHKRPSLHFFPDKSTAWMFAQPRYGIAALFVLFLGLHLLQRPMPEQQVGSSVIEEPGIEMDLAAVAETNSVSSPVPQPVPTAQPVYSSLARPVSFSK
jgi:hypothetical protein